MQTVGEDIAQLRSVNEEVIPRRANHVNLAKFSTRADKCYQRVCEFVLMTVPDSAVEDQRAFIRGRTTLGSIRESESFGTHHITLLSSPR